MSEQTPQPSPELFFQTLNAYQRTAAIKAALELDVFTAIGEGAQTAPELAARCETAERGMRILCDYLVVIGFLTKDGGAYGLTPDSSVFLDRRSPAYMGGVTEFLLSPLLTSGFEDLAGVVRRGTTAMPEGGTVAPENPIWVKFARAMVPMMAMAAQEIAGLANEGGGKLKVLDIAAGHGMFGITVARQNPDAEVVALDWPNVLEVAQENARGAGVAERYKTIEGSALDVDYGTGYDVVLLTNFLHHFDPPTCERLLRKVHAALREGGRAVALEFVPNEDRVSPPIPAAFSMMMLGSTPSGDAYTFPELERMFRNAGFSHSEIRQLPATPEQLIISRK
ncbi:MAG TPA: class I SAM-dependent methyltransferase [Pyrinomonadaceae bacterium]|jgi:ubiquinone/menaquinone biosynthesis C-methylase UbiE|nr:class I SAM-dependent methyltransferase [Pyrinomonadaceae bacterium]